MTFTMVCISKIYEDVWRKFIFSAFTWLPLNALCPPSKKATSWWGVSAVCGNNGAPLLARVCPLLGTFHTGPPRPPHWVLRARSANKDSAGASSTEDWLTVEWKRREFWLTQEEWQLNMFVRGAATTCDWTRACDPFSGNVRNAPKRGPGQDSWALTHPESSVLSEWGRCALTSPTLPRPKTCVLLWHC